MAILLKCGAVFLHIPKTGGNWVAEALEANDLVFAHIGEKHANLNQICEFETWFRRSEKYGKFKGPFIKFCFVRHPLQWYESWFKMQTRLKWPKWGEDKYAWHPNGVLDGLGDSDFNRFVQNVLTHYPGYVSALYSWYTSGEIDYIGKQENLADDLVRILRKLNVDFDESKLRAMAPVNKGGPLALKWDSRLQEDVLRHEHSALKRFSYIH